jgi:hypothetical protein
MLTAQTRPMTMLWSWRGSISSTSQSRAKRFKPRARARESGARGETWSARASGLTPRPPVGQRAFVLHRRDLCGEQFVVHRDLACTLARARHRPSFGHVTLTRLAAASAVAASALAVPFRPSSHTTRRQARANPVAGQIALALGLIEARARGGRGVRTVNDSQPALATAILAVGGGTTLNDA